VAEADDKLAILLPPFPRFLSPHVLVLDAFSYSRVAFSHDPVAGITFIIIKIKLHGWRLAS
jgi:hypothetical protein